MFEKAGSNELQVVPASKGRETKAQSLLFSTKLAFRIQVRTGAWAPAQVFRKVVSFLCLGGVA